MSWVELPIGQDIPIQKDVSYAVVASVKADHLQAQIEGIAQKHNLAVFRYAEQGQQAGLGPDPNSPDYRYVALSATADADGGTIPWSVPWPVSMVDSSHIVRAWRDAGGIAIAGPSGGSSSVATALLAIVGLAGVGGAVWWFWGRDR
jgi:hypothetical protein